MQHNTALFRGGTNNKTPHSHAQEGADAAHKALKAQQVVAVGRDVNLEDLIRAGARRSRLYMSVGG